MVGEWTDTTLGGVTDFLSGGTPSKDRPDYWAGSIPWVSAKEAIDEGCELPLQEGLEVEAPCYELVLPTRDRLEALAAFAEKRKPEYTGS